MRCPPFVGNFHLNLVDARLFAARVHPTPVRRRGGDGRHDVVAVVSVRRVEIAVDQMRLFVVGLVALSWSSHGSPPWVIVYPIRAWRGEGKLRVES